MGSQAKKTVGMLRVQNIGRPRMGDPRRRKPHATLDGGEPSDDRIVLEIEIFSPLQEILHGELHRNGAARLAAIREAMAKSGRRPTPICTACDYVFALGEPPALIWLTRPFAPKAEPYTSISGMVCPRCATQPPSELMQALFARLRALKPDLEMIPAGSA
jgi:hypothetical protein